MRLSDDKPTTEPKVRAAEENPWTLMSSDAMAEAPYGVLPELCKAVNISKKPGRMLTVEMICGARDQKMGCDYVICALNADVYQIKMVEKGSG
jgi:hypothetical protein